jgi:CheY-like chemotaxis protein
VRILVVDDDLESEDLRDLFKARLTAISTATMRGVDEKTRREMVDTELAKEGFELEFVFDGDAALTHYRHQGPYDLVLTDLYHPGMKGVELALAIRRESPMQALAVFSAGITMNPPIEALWQMHIPATDKLDTWESLRQLVEDAISVNHERLANRLTRTVQ